MAKMVIVEGNSNDKDNVRALMVKGERGYSAYEIAVQNGYEGTEAEWKDSFLNAETYYNKTETDNLLDEKTCIYDTVALMKADTNLKNGMIAKTLGYYEVNDGGGALYKILETTPAVGYYETLDSGLYAQLIIENVMNSKQLGMQDNTDITSKLQTFFDLAYENKDKEFDLIGGNYKVSGMITINPYSKICLKGKTYIEDNNENSITFNVISNATETPTDEQNLSFLFDNSNGCIILDNTKDVNKIALSITSVSSSPAKRINANIKGLQLSHYTTGLSLNTFNTYIMEISNCNFSFCEHGVYLGLNGAINNSGENISFSNCIFTRCDCAIYSPVSIRTDYNQCSFDFNSCILYIPNENESVTATFTNCWIEGSGQKTASSSENTFFNSFSGMVYANDTSYWYNKNIVNFNNCQICHLQGKRTSSLCSGNSLLLTFTNNTFWYSEDVAKVESFGDLPMKQLLIADNVKNIKMKDNNYRFTSHFIPSINDSLIDPFLTNEELDTTGATIGSITNDYFANFDIDALGQATGTTIKKVQVNGTTCIELTPPYNGATSNITLISKKYYPINNSYRIYANAGLKGFKGTNHTYIAFGLKFYDAELNLLDSKEIGSSYRSDTTGIDSTKFMFGYRPQDCYNNDLPKGTAYCRFTFRLFALSGVNDNWNQPVQYTGFYAIME